MNERYLWLKEKDIIEKEFNIRDNYFLNTLGSNYVEKFLSLTRTQWMILDMLVPLDYLYSNIRHKSRVCLKRHFFKDILRHLELYMNQAKDYKDTIDTYNYWIKEIDIMKDVKFDNNMKIANPDELIKKLKKIFSDFDESIDELIKWKLVKYTKTPFNIFFRKLRWYELDTQGFHFLEVKTKAVGNYPNFMNSWIRF